MKLSKILLTTLIALAFTATANADRYKLKVCERAETSFWDTVQSTYSSADHSFIDSLDATNQRAYLKLAQSKIEKSMAEVRNRCKTTDKDIIAAFEKKKSEIQEQLIKVNDL
jgi:hypothetical protein